MKAYKKRMIEEYKQLKERTHKLEKIINKYDASKLDFELSTPIYVLQDQLGLMRNYMDILKLRAEFEDIDLEY